MVWLPVYDADEPIDAGLLHARALRKYLPRTATPTAGIPDTTQMMGERDGRHRARSPHEKHWTKYPRMAHLRFQRAFHPLVGTTVIEKQRGRPEPYLALIP